MRKDVRMGFGVGGVLLTVLVVAILFFHRTKNADKAVAFDTGGKPAVGSGTDLSATDVTPAPDGTASAAASNTSAPVSTAPPANAPSSETKPPAPPDDSVQKSGAKWDSLFASTAADPIKAQLTSETLGKPKNKKKHKPEVAAPEMSDKHDSASASAVANAPLETRESTTPEAAPARPVAHERLTTVAPVEPGRTHVVASGETFVSIARAVYGDGRYYQAIIDANPSVDPAKLRPGVSIQLPPDSQVKQGRKSARSSGDASSSAGSSDGKTYTVQSGDSLYKIAKKLYHNGEKSADLYEANKQTIGPDSTRLKIGMVLTVP
jgi:nucleoid-associated protein YgaU